MTVYGASRRLRLPAAIRLLLAAALAAALPRPAAAAVPSPPLFCIDFSPYVGDMNPDTGPHPSAADISILLDLLIQRTATRCIMTYGVLNGLDATFQLAQERHLKVVAILWIDQDTTVNDQSIAAGIQAARAYPYTIIRLSCGSEVRARNRSIPGANLALLDAEVAGCIGELRAAAVPQPITTIDTWWEWCNQARPCEPSSFASQVDWIGINVHPWWENRFSGIFPCTPAEQAAAFLIARLQELIDRYPTKEIVVTEFGWPAGPSGHRETNIRTGHQCGVASQRNQLLVARSALAELRVRGWSGFIFEGFRQPWKAKSEGVVGPEWGICTSSTCAVDRLYFTDDPAARVSTAIKGVHIQELRDRVAALREGRGLSRVSWIDSNVLPGSTTVKADHLNQVREALAAVYSSDGLPLPTYTANISVGGVITALDLNETRNAIQAIE